ncbi:MAG: alanine:cation symporter family protein, partial [Gemmatimonadetes bacterium]|nr:alanine:cation symporter family protein [Gemmatimonadota bacterium]
MGRAMKALFLLTTMAAPALAEDEAGASGIQHHLSRLDGLFGDTVNLLATFLFAEFGTGVPLIVGVLVAGGVYYSFYFGWLSIRGFRHSIDVIRGRYDNPDDPGEISHFQALTSALSATIGLGNIAGVAI